MGKGTFGDDDAFWKEFAASNNLGNLDGDAFVTDSDTGLGSGDPSSSTANRSKATTHSASRRNKSSKTSARPSAFNPNKIYSPGTKAKTTSQFIIALAIAAIPIGLYLVQPGSLKDMFNRSSISSEERGRVLEQEARRISETLKSFATEKSTARTGSIKPIKATPKKVAAKSTENIIANFSAKNETALEHGVKHSKPNYVCPMHSSVINTDPNAICPICGMDLVLIESGAESGLVTLTPTVMNSLGVRTAKVKRRTLYRRINSVGYINIDENNIRVVTLRTEGWVERLVIKTAGEHVSKGQLLFEIYSPILVNAQDEFLQALRHSNKPLISASKERLLALGISQEQISQLEKEKKVEQLVQVYAPQDGIISELNVREGMHVKPSQVIVNLVDLSSVWLMVDIFERQASWVKKGQRAEATLPFMPGRSWEGMVEYVYPSLDASTRSLKVRLRFDNFKEELKPNMYADVAIYAKPKKKVLAIPREALIRTGKDKRVIVALGKGKFLPMSVQVGMETDSKIEILSGLAEGDNVVTSSQFLIDSESSLRASLARMAGGG